MNSQNNCNNIDNTCNPDLTLLDDDLPVVTDENGQLITRLIELNEVGDSVNGYLNSFGTDQLFYEDSATDAAGLHGGFLYNMSDAISLGYQQSVMTEVINTTTETELIDTTDSFRGNADIFPDAARVGSMTTVKIRAELDNGGPTHDLTLRFFVAANLIYETLLDLPSLSGVGNMLDVELDFLIAVVDSVNGIIRVNGNIFFIKNNDVPEMVGVSVVNTGIDTTFQGGGEISVTAQWSNTNANNILIVRQLQLFDRT